MNDSPTSRRSSGTRALTAFLAAAAALIGYRALRGPGRERMTLPRGRALITGASSGIGEAFARQLAAKGFDLVLLARREERLQALAADLKATYGVRVTVLAADLSRDDEIARVVAAIGEMNDLVLLVNNAGFGTRGSFAEVPLERHLDMIRVHDIASIALTWAALPGMTGRGRGAVINVSSIAAFFPSGGGATYTATKAYLNNFSEALAGELQGTGVKVQALCPGFTYSEFHETPEYEGFDRGVVPAAFWMPASQVVDESLAALSGDQVIVVPGRHYRAMVLAINSPIRAAIQKAARFVRGRWHNRM